MVELEVFSIPAVIFSWSTLSNAIFQSNSVIVRLVPVRSEMSMRLRAIKMACEVDFFGLKPN